MKILYIGVHSHLDWGAEYWLVKAFHEIGLQYELLDYRKDFESINKLDPSVLNLAKEQGSYLKESKVNPLWQKEFAVISKEFDSDPDKKNAFEIGSQWFIRNHC